MARIHGFDMEVSSIAAYASANAMQQLQQQVSVALLKKAMEVQGQAALQLLEALPQAAPAASGPTGTVIDTYA